MSTEFYHGLIDHLNKQESAIPNVDPVTGYPYGVFQGNSAADLLNEIQTQGYDLSLHDAEASVRQVIEALGNPDPEESLEDELDMALRALSDLIGDVHEDTAAEWVTEHADRDQHSFDVEALAEDVLAYMHERWEVEEMGPMLYAEDGIIYRQSYLGGAPLVWVIRSRFLAPAAYCSPCVPGAIDLDSPMSWDFEGLSGPVGLCPPPSEIWVDSDYHGLWAKRIAEIDPQTGEVVAWWFPPNCEPKKHPNCYLPDEIVGISVPPFQSGMQLMRWDGSAEVVTETDLFSLTEVTLDEAVVLYCQAAALGSDAGKDFLAKLEPLLHRLDLPKRRITLK